MAQSNLTGAPTLFGDVIKFKLGPPQVAPTFDQSFDVKVRKVQPSAVPSIEPWEPEVTRVTPENATFNYTAEVQIHKVNGG